MIMKNSFGTCVYLGTLHLKCWHVIFLCVALLFVSGNLKGEVVILNCISIYFLYIWDHICFKNILLILCLCLFDS